ncbi:hypothetical protein RB593_001523 [Gaeumannomyces tritici]
MSPTKPHVLIAGAGIGGLALAQMLRRRDIPFSIFERGDDGHTQGWAIAVHGIVQELVASFPDDLPPLAESVNNLRALGNVPAEFVLYPAGDGAAGLRFGDDGSNTRLVRANRALLRKYLSTNIAIQYGKKAVAAAQEGDRVTVRFEDGTSAEGDILVGADGVHSASEWLPSLLFFFFKSPSYPRQDPDPHPFARPVRRSILPGPDRLETLPFACIMGEVPLSGEAMRRQMALGRSAYILRPPYPGGKGQFFVGTNIVRDGGDCADFYWMMLFAQEEGDTDPDDLARHWHATSSRADLLERAVAESRLMDPALSEVVRQTPAEGIVKPPLVLRALHLPGLPVGRMTLLGDATHTMPPFRGEGGVNALVDALRLGEAIGKIAAGDVDVATAMEEYQAEMLERGNRAVTMSVDAVETDVRVQQMFDIPAKARVAVEVS